jgi:hypothetical protein
MAAEDTHSGGYMRTRSLLSAGMMGALLVLACSKSEPAETAPETAAGAAPDTTTADAGAARDSVTAAEGAYRDSAVAAEGAYRDSVVAAEGAYRDSAAAASRSARDSAAGAAAAYGDSAADGRPDTSRVMPDTTGLGAGADSVRSDSM